jgi:hypothetical protein
MDATKAVRVRIFPQRATKLSPFKLSPFKLLPFSIINEPCDARQVARGDKLKSAYQIKID